MVWGGLSAADSSSCGQLREYFYCQHNHERECTSSYPKGRRAWRSASTTKKETTPATSSPLSARMGMGRASESTACSLFGSTWIRLNSWWKCMKGLRRNAWRVNVNGNVCNVEDWLEKLWRESSGEEVVYRPKVAAKKQDARRSTTVMMEPNTATPFEWSNLNCKNDHNYIDTQALYEWDQSNSTHQAESEARLELVSGGREELIGDVFGVVPRVVFRDRYPTLIFHWNKISLHWSDSPTFHCFTDSSISFYDLCLHFETRLRLQLPIAIVISRCYWASHASGERNHSKTGHNMTT